MLVEAARLLRAWASVPVKACDAPDVSCARPAQVWVSVHGCDGFVLCGQHLQDFVFQVNEAVGAARLLCTGCGQRFGALPQFMRWRLI